MSYIRVTLLPTTPSQPFLQMDILSTDLVLSEGRFQPVQVAPTVTLMSAPVEHEFTPFDSLQAAQAVTVSETQEVKISYREPVDTQVYTDTQAIEQPDPTDGIGVYGITLNETRITFAKVAVTN
jgi:hypothetical protein